MDDLRDDYNVQKEGGTPFSMEKWWIKNKGILRLFLVLSIFIFILIKPDLIGKYIGLWLGNLINSFSSVINVTSEQWYVILITLVGLSFCYFLLNRRNKN